MKTTKWILKGLMIAFLAIGIAACSDDDKVEIVTHSLTLDFTKKDLQMGVTSKQVITITDGNSGYKVLSSDEKVAKVAINGNTVTIDALSVGNALITISDKMQEKKEINLTITEGVWHLEGAYVLNAGKNESNNAVLGFYSTASKKYQEIFEAANAGVKLGDTGNDMLVYGSKMYIAVSESKVVFVTDLNGKLINEHKLEKDPVKDKPRHLTAADGFVYASFFNGYVAKIDTLSNTSIVGEVEVGRYPEQLKATNGKLYVANSGGLDYNNEKGYDKTVSVIDLKTFKEEKKIEVVINPEQIQVDKDGNVYVLSKGNYGDVLNTLQKIDAKTQEVTKITEATYIAVNEDLSKMYAVYNQYDENWQTTSVFFTYDFAAGKIDNKSFITDGTKIDKFFSLSVNPVNGDIYITTSDYTSSGDVLIFSKDGKLQNKFKADLNPRVYFRSAK